MILSYIMNLRTLRSNAVGTVLSIVVKNVGSKARMSWFECQLYLLKTESKGWVNETIIYCSILNIKRFLRNFLCPQMCWLLGTSRCKENLCPHLVHEFLGRTGERQGCQCRLSALCWVCLAYVRVDKVHKSAWRWGKEGYISVCL